MTPERPHIDPMPAGETPVPATLQQPAENAPPRDPFWDYTDLAWFIGTAIASIVAGSGVELLVGAAIKPKIIGVAAGMVALYALLFGALKMMFRVRYDRPFWNSLDWKPTRLPAMWALLSGMVTAVVVQWASALIHTPTGETPMTKLLDSRADVVIMGTIGVTLAPVCEELAFRGFLQPLLVRSVGAAGGVLLTAIPFGLLHFREYGDSWRHALIIAMAGAAFGWMRQATGSTKAAAIMHAGFNLLPFIALMTEKNILPHPW